ncbi:MAG: M20 family metallopeptidase [Bacteroidota bacterium]
MEQLIPQIKSLAVEYYDRVVGYRRHLHQHPELSFEEYKTSTYIKTVLDDLGIAYRDGLGGGTGISADIGQGDRCIALRADIDALPIAETSVHSYVSVHNGVMHACGHDVHTASLLGALHILHRMEKLLPHRVRFIFQPGEELLPGGASMMIADEVLSQPRVSQIYGQHVHPSLVAGQVGICPEYFMASCDEIYISVHGRGGHGAMPHQVIDPVQISAQVILALQSIVSRRANPSVASVLSIGKIRSDGGATNVIPSRVDMDGTFRTFDESWRAEAHDLIVSLVKQIASAHGGSAEVRIVRGYPALYNDPRITQQARAAMIAYLGQDKVVDLPQRMTAEDFAYYSHQVPACFYRLGTAAADGSKSSPVHTSTFDIDESALQTGMGLMAWMAFQGSTK